MNNKGINNIILVILIILIITAGVTLIWTYAGNTLHREGKSIEKAGTFTGAGEKSTGIENKSEGEDDSNDDLNNDILNEECNIEKIYWFSNDSEVGKVMEGEDVSLVVKGKNCEGKNVKISIWERDICIFGMCSDYFVKNYSVEFDEDDLIIEIRWKAEWAFDSILGGDPEYYFIINIDNIEIKSKELIVERNEGSNSPPSEECKTLVYNGEDKIDVVVFSDSQTAETYANIMLGSYPLSEYKNAFNFYYIDDYPTNDTCEIYKGIALLCRSKGMIRRASSCPVDYIMVVQEHDSNIRSSAFMNIMSINSNLPKSVVQHEFGHVFASLAEEYAPAIIPKNAKNCAKNENENKELDCDRHFGSVVGVDRDGCFVECSDYDYRRSIEAGVMRTLSSDRFGLFNDNLIVERLKEEADLTESVVGNVQNSPDLCSNEEYYLVKAVYDSGKDDIDLIDVSAQEGCADEDSNGYGRAKIETLKEETNEVIEESNFNPELIFIDGNDKLNENGENVIDGQTIINEDPFYLKIPIYKEEYKKIRVTSGKNIELYKLDGKRVIPVAY